MGALASVVIPAHNEARTIARNLTALLDGFAPGELEVVVVCNGCSDDTAALARATAAAIRVVEIGVPSKIEAVRVGNAATDVFPRVHLDADVELSGRSLRALVAPLTADEVLATAPRRILSRDRSSALVRWYYDVWEQLPQVGRGLFGRGAIALSEEGQARVSSLPRIMSDDLAISDAFEDWERRVVVDAEVVVRPPTRVVDLIRRRVRVVTGNAQAAQQGVRRQESATTYRVLVQLVVDQPRLALRMPVFLAVTALARLLSRRAVRSGDYTTWHRDESSRQ
jgi:glycosyltransferase involved in cell wall biosynthesis